MVQSEHLILYNTTLDERIFEGSKWETFFSCVPECNITPTYSAAKPGGERGACFKC